MPRTPSAIVFLHISKTAGMSLRGQFDKNYPNCRHFNTELDEVSRATWGECLGRLRQISGDELNETGVFKGHMQFGLHEILSGPVDYITFLRDPVKRIISHYRMEGRKGNIPPDHQIDLAQPDWNLGCCPPLVRSFDNGQTRALAGTCPDLPFRACTEQHLAQAKSNIEKHFKFVGLTEQFDLSLLLLRRLCGWGFHFYVPDNQAKERDASLPPSLIEAIRQLNRLDLELYRYAQERFQGLLKQYGFSLQVEHQVYRAGNYLHQRLHVWRHRIKRRLGCERRPAMLLE